MFFEPLKGALNVIDRERVLESPEMLIEAAPTAHWLFCRSVLVLNSLELDPVALSERSAMVPAFRS